MNAADRKEFDIIHNKIDDIKKDIDELKQSMNNAHQKTDENLKFINCLLYTSPSPRDLSTSRMPSSA